MSGFDLFKPRGGRWCARPACRQSGGRYSTIEAAQLAADELNQYARGESSPRFGVSPPERYPLRYAWVVDALRILSAHTDGIIGLQFDQPGTDPEPLGVYLFRPADPATTRKMRGYLAFGETIEACCEHALTKLSPAELSAAMLKAGVS